MFTGIIETLGSVRAFSARCLEIALEHEFPDEPLVAGESISVNGCCLTTTCDQGLQFDLSEETLERTTLGRLQVGDLVNLERAMRIGDRLGGHLVSGHVDDQCTLDEVTTLDGSWLFSFTSDPAQLHLLTDKGSVTLDGISLTVIEPNNGRFQVAVIPHTYSVTTLQKRKPGDKLNLEYDLFAKYVAKIVRQ